MDTFQEMGVFNKKIFTAARNNDITTVKQLLGKKDINLDKYKDLNSYTLLSVAVENGNVEMAELLIDNNASVNSTCGLHDFPVLMFAGFSSPTDRFRVSTIRTSL